MMARTAVNLGGEVTDSNNDQHYQILAKRAQRLRRLLGELPDGRNDPLAEVMRPLSDMTLLPAKGSESLMLKGYGSGERDFRRRERSRNVGRKLTTDLAG